MSGRSQTPPDLAWAAYLVASWWRSAGPPMQAPAAPVEPEAILARLRRNGFPLLTLAADTPEARRMLATDPFTIALQQDRDKMVRQQAAFREIAAAWSNRGISALFVKAMGPLPSFPYVSNNLDVLVPQARQDEARQVVRELNYIELRHIEEPNKFLFRRFHAGESAFDLHIHGRLEWHTEFVDSAAVWARASYAPDCDGVSGERLALVPAPEDGLLIALAHAAYENKAYKLIELAKLGYACRVLDTNWDRVADGARRRGWLPGLSAILVSMDAWERQLYGSGSLPAEVLARAESQMPARLRHAVTRRFAGATKAPVRLPFSESKRLFYEKMLADPSQTRPARMYEAWTHTLYGARVKLKLHSQKPLLVAFDGIDGSGKSAQAELLAKALEGAALRHRVVWTRGGSSRLLQPWFVAGKRLLRTPGGTTGTATEQPGAPGSQVASREASRSAMFKHPLVKRLWPWAIAAELGATWLIRVRWPLLRGEVVVADRYVLSALVELAARTGAIESNIANQQLADGDKRARMTHWTRSLPVRLLRAIAPRPERTYWFNVPPEVALARKGADESPEFLATQAAVAPFLVEACDALDVDATRQIDELSDRIVADVLGRYDDRHRTLLNGLFCANPRRLPAGWRRPELTREVLVRKEGKA